jgi:hypothetical protein
LAQLAAPEPVEALWPQLSGRTALPQPRLLEVLAKALAELEAAQR